MQEEGGRPKNIYIIIIKTNIICYTKKEEGERNPTQNRERVLYTIISQEER